MRSSVLILPPVVRVGGSRSRSTPRHVVEPVGKCRRLPLCAKREPVVTRLPSRGNCCPTPATYAAVALDRDPTICGAGRSVRVGDGWCLPPLGGIGVARVLR